jgi:2-keto-4-pentenoate hydratase/2-oxohepta-3-ene-1,7-dioic acid hydratase in catechol pathway
VRLATIAEAGGGGRPAVALVRDGSVLPLTGAGAGLDSIRAIAAAGDAASARIAGWAGTRPATDWRPVAEVTLGPVVPNPGAIYTIGLNYRADPGPDPDAPPRPLVYGKAASSVAGHDAVVAWDRSLTANVDAECELGVVIGEPAWRVTPGEAMRHVFGWTIVDDISSRDPWLDGDQWLLGKSMPGFCPVGPWLVTRDELDPADVRLGCTINGEPIQDGSSAGMRFSTAEIVAFLSRHVTLRPGDIIATGTPARLAGPPGPDRHLEAGDVVTAWIEGIGELTTRIA